MSLTQDCPFQKQRQHESFVQMFTSFSPDIPPWRLRDRPRKGESSSTLLKHDEGSWGGDEVSGRVFSVCL